MIGAGNTRTPRKHFELAPLEALDPEKIVAKGGSDRFQMFMLTLALVWNDFKGLVMVADAFKAYKPPKGEVSASAGQWNGLDMQIHRLKVGLMWELMEFLAKFRVEASDPRVFAMLKQTEPQATKDWRDLIRIATRSPIEAERTFTNVLKTIRNNSAFHYYDPRKLVAGYRRHFFGGNTGPGYESAFRSFDGTVPKTRFYFADAAIESLLLEMQGEGEGDHPPAFLQDLIRVQEQMYKTVGFLVVAYTDSARRRSEA